MKQLFVLAGCAAILSAFAGCKAADKGAHRGVEVLVEGGGKFPRSLAGTWSAREKGWEFVFERDGTISSAVIDSGMVRVKPSRKVTKASLRDGGEAIYKLGRWTVQYTPQNRELAVEVVVDYCRIGIADRGLEGSSIDWFVGPVSEDSKTWKAEWFTFPKYVMLAPEPEPMPFDPNENPIETLIFRKQRKKN